MMNHLIKLIWNRKRSNLLIITEVAVTFMVLFAVISTARHLYQTYNKPLGFNWQNTWAINVNVNNWDGFQQQLKNVVEVLRQQDEIESVGLTNDPVFRNSESVTTVHINDKSLMPNVLVTSDGALQNWGVKLLAGRWFSSIDNNQNYEPIVINEQFAKEAFGNGDPLGFDIPNRFKEGAPPQRIVGVFKEFRQRGEFSTPVPYMFARYQLGKGELGMRYIHLTFAAEQSAAYEGKLIKLLKEIAPNWDFTVNTWAAMRQDLHDKVVIPMIILSVVVGFLLIMVAMGLLGVLWQNINQRTREIGLRRAVGASTGSIQTQIIGELVTLALFSMLVASIILFQVPFLNLIGMVTWSNFWFSLGSASVMILAIVILCALYPSRVAIKMAPALALHYE